MTFDACEVFPGFTVNGNVNRISTGDDEQSFRLELNNVTGGDSDSSFFINGTFEETVGDDGSLTFVADINSSSTLDDETDITNVVGTLTVAANGDMSGGFALPKRCRNTLDCATACDLTGFNIFTLLASPDGFEAAFQEACEQSISIDCGPGQIPFLLINGGNEPAHILAPEEIQSDATLLQPGGSRPVCVPFAQGQVVNFRLFTESGGFALRACAHTEFPTIFPLEGQIQFLDEPFGLYCNGTVFD